MSSSPSSLDAHSAAQVPSSSSSLSNSSSQSSHVNQQESSSVHTLELSADPAIIRAGPHSARSSPSGQSQSQSQSRSSHNPHSIHSSASAAPYSSQPFYSNVYDHSSPAHFVHTVAHHHGGGGAAFANNSLGGAQYHGPHAAYAVNGNSFSPSMGYNVNSDALHQYHALQAQLNSSYNSINADPGTIAALQLQLQLRAAALQQQQLQPYQQQSMHAYANMEEPQMIEMMNNLQLQQQQQQVAAVAAVAAAAANANTAAASVTQSTIIPNNSNNNSESGNSESVSPSVGSEGNVLDLADNPLSPSMRVSPALPIQHQNAYAAAAAAAAAYYPYSYDVAQQHQAAMMHMNYQGNAAQGMNMNLDMQQPNMHMQMYEQNAPLHTINMNYMEQAHMNQHVNHYNAGAYQSSPRRANQYPSHQSPNKSHSRSPQHQSPQHQQHQQQQQQHHDHDKVGAGTYKTEICRSHAATRTCVYGSTCQFAHGIGELRSRQVDTKYKTERCKKYHAGREAEAAIAAAAAAAAANSTSDSSSSAVPAVDTAALSESLGGCPYSCRSSDGTIVNRCRFSHDEYRIKINELEWWLVCPSENVIRVERVESSNQERLKQLNLLLTDQQQYFAAHNLHTLPTVDSPDMHLIHVASNANSNRNSNNNTPYRNSNNRNQNHSEVQQAQHEHSNNDNQHNNDNESNNHVNNDNNNNQYSNHNIIAPQAISNSAVSTVLDYNLLEENNEHKLGSSTNSPLLSSLRVH